MAVGDIVNGMSTPATVLTFQPAATIVISIKSTLLDNYANYNACMTNAAANVSAFNGMVDGAWNMANMNFLIDNTRFLRINSVGGRTGYTGIQIQ